MDTGGRLRRSSPVRTGGAAALVALSLAACGGGSSHSNSAGNSGATTTSVSGGGAGPSTSAPGSGLQTAACTLPLTHDTYDGFHIAVPAGWDLSTLNGEILVENNPQATEAVLLYPARKSSSLTASSFFTSYLAQLSQQAKTAGHPVTATSEAPRNGFPVDALSGTEGNQAVQGQATVSQLPLATNTSSSELVFTAYWAPPSALPAETGRLAAIAACYGPEPGALFRLFKDQVFTYMMPAGWTVGDESQNNIDLHLGTADVSYLLIEAASSTQVSSAQGLINFVLGKDGFTNVQSVSTVSSPSQAEQAGTQTIEYEEFTANFNGLADHGLIYAVADVGGGVASGVVRLALSSANQWNALNSGLIQMAGAIQHDFSQDLQQIQQVNQEFQNFSGQVDNFDDVLNNQQLVQDPTTGNYYEAPYTRYQVDAPGGPGYYLDNGQKLNEIERP